MKLSESNKKEVLKCTVSDKEIGSYQDTKLPTLSRSFYLILETFQFEVFSFLMSTTRLRGRFKRFRKHFRKYFDGFDLDEERMSRALDILLDHGFMKAYWVEKRGKFFREFRNKSEASSFLGKISINYKAGDAWKNTDLFDSLD